MSKLRVLRNESAAELKTLEIEKERVKKIGEEKKWEALALK